jgi:transcriptional regulator of acetoin/glycerol metabolism
MIDVDDLPPAIASNLPSADPVAATEPPHGYSTTDLEDIERTTIERVFQQVKGDKALAGKMLGISRATLYRKLKRYNIGSRSLSASSQALQ